MVYYETLKQFIFNGLLLNDSFSLLEQQGITVRSSSQEKQIERIEEASFSPRIIFDAKKMSSVFIVFYCLENAVRELITERLAERYGVDWWDKCLSPKIKSDVSKLIQQEEKNRYHSKRSNSLIGYTMFGNLVQIVINNWDDFSDIFPSQAWLSSRFTDLEMSRNIIMHTGVLPDIEIERIESIARDWIRQVG